MMNVQVEWPVEKAPTLVMFESEEPHFYQGDLSNSEEILTWMREFVDMDPVVEVEEVAEEEAEGDGVEG